MEKEEVKVEIEEPEEKSIAEEVEVIEDSKEETIVIENVVKREPIVHTLSEKDFTLLETALEIRYTSLQLHKFPVEFSTVNKENRKIVKSFGVTNLKIKNWNVKKCETKIFEINSKKFLEIKANEFLLGFEINLKENGSFSIINNNYYYKIKENSSIVRYLDILKMLKEIFSGETFEIDGKLMEGSLSFENRIEVMKFELLETEISELDKKKIAKILMNRNELYPIALLNLADSNAEIDSWVNVKKRECNKFAAGDSIIVERLHELNGVGYNLKEKIIFIDPVVEKELANNDFTAYRRKCKIILEKISKN